MFVYVSIHAPVMDANNAVDNIDVLFDVSIHAPVMDANHLVIGHCSSHWFQSTRP